VEEGEKSEGVRPPTYGEAGHKGLVLEQWLGLFVGAGAPAAGVARLNAEVNRALAEPAVRERYAQAGLEPVGGAPEQFARLSTATTTKYTRASSRSSTSASNSGARLPAACPARPAMARALRSGLHGGADLPDVSLLDVADDVPPDRVVAVTPFHYLADRGLGPALRIKVAPAG